MKHCRHDTNRNDDLSLRGNCSTMERQLESNYKLGNLIERHGSGSELQLYQHILTLSGSSLKRRKALTANGSQKVSL